MYEHVMHTTRPYLELSPNFNHRLNNLSREQTLELSDDEED